MSHDLAGLLATAVPEPRTVFDPDVLLQAARLRQTRRRRATAGGVLAVAAVVAAGVAVLPRSSTSAPKPIGGAALGVSALRAAPTLPAPASSLLTSAHLRWDGTFASSRISATEQVYLVGATGGKVCLLDLLSKPTPNSSGSCGSRADLLHPGFYVAGQLSAGAPVHAVVVVPDGYTTATAGTLSTTVAGNVAVLDVTGSSTVSVTLTGPRQTTVTLNLGQLAIPNTSTSSSADPAGSQLQQRLTARAWVLASFTDAGTTAAPGQRTVLQFGAHGFLIDGACNDETGHVGYTAGTLVMRKAAQTGPVCPQDDTSSAVPVQALDDLADGPVAAAFTSDGLMLSTSGVTATFTGGPVLHQDLGLQLPPATAPVPAPSGSSTPTAAASSAGGAVEGPRIDWDARLNSSSVVTAQQLTRRPGLQFTPVLPKFGMTPTRIDVSSDAGQGAAGGLAELHFTFPTSSAFPVDGRVIVREQPVALAPGGLAELAGGHTPTGFGTPTQIAGHLSLLVSDKGYPASFSVTTVRGKTLVTIAGPALSQQEAIKLASHL